MRRFVYEHSLSLAMFGLFLLTLGAQSVAGFNVNNEDRKEHGQAQRSYIEYLGSGHFIEAVFENWESEFLQMGAFVLLTVFLRQKGSPESKKLSGDEPVDDDPRSATRLRKNAPWPVRRGGAWLSLYENSLSVALFSLFFFSLALHAIGGSVEYNEEQLAHGGQTVSVLGFVGTPQFWFQSMQNWQSEFLSIGVLIVLAIFLRQKGSPESKPVAAPHDLTGGD
jgi:uncharacterized protein DUF6766